MTTQDVNKQTYHNQLGKPAKVLFSSGSEYEVFELETATGKVIPLEHHEIHEGNHFISGAVNSNMGDGDTLTLCFKVPAGTKLPHMLIEWKAKAAAHIEFWENPTWSGESGRPVNIENNNRNYTVKSVLQNDYLTGTFSAGRLLADPSLFTGGIIVGSDYIWTDFKTGGGDRTEAEFVLKADTTYGIRVTADAATNAALIRLYWYEYTFKT